MLKKGDLAQRIGGFEKLGLLYRGKQLYIVTKPIKTDEGYYYYEGVLYLLDNDQWLKTDFFEWEVSEFNPSDFKKHFHQIISSLFYSL